MGIPMVWRMDLSSGDKKSAGRGRGKEECRRWCACDAPGRDESVERRLVVLSSGRASWANSATAC